jgi:hypothetical protein
MMFPKTSKRPLSFYLQTDPASGRILLVVADVCDEDRLGSVRRYFFENSNVT